MKKIEIKIATDFIDKIKNILDTKGVWVVGIILSFVSVFYFIYFLQNGLGLSYNDARSHLDIARRVVEGLKPGLAQLGSVWLPLNHVLMIVFVWNDWAWHSGFAGAFWNMVSFVGTGIFIYKYLEIFKVKTLAKFFAVFVFAANLNILYLQSTAMTEPLLLFTMLAGCYYLTLWAGNRKILNLIKSSFWIMLSTLVRYDGWFLLLFAAVIVLYLFWRKKGYKASEGLTILFLTMAGFGIFLWFLWNLVIFKDPLYFAFGPFSAHAQQEVLYEAGDLLTKGNLFLSTKIYFYALFFNSITSTAVVGLIAFLYMMLNKNEEKDLKIASFSLMSPLFFNVIALIAGFSVVFVQGISGDTWFNVRYGVMMMPALAIYLGYLVDRIKSIRWLTIITFVFVAFFAFANSDAVTIDDARVGSSQKNVSEVANYLNKNAKDKEGFILISAASHDAIIFSSGLPMKKFIHEGTGKYWDLATTSPDHWARWIVLRTYDENDLTYKALKDNQTFKEKYNLVDSYPFADVYQLDEKYLNLLSKEGQIDSQK